jgi:hypothetical protein
MKRFTERHKQIQPKCVTSLQAYVIPNTSNVSKIQILVCQESQYSIMIAQSV